LVAGDTNNAKDIFVHDRLLKTTKRVSVPDVGTQQSNGVSDNPSISANGRFIAFESDANNLVTGDTNALSDVFVRDTFLNKTLRISISSGGIQGKGASTAPKVSANGQNVVFNSQADFLAGGGTFNKAVYTHNLFTKQTTLIPQDTFFDNEATSISANGRYVTLNGTVYGSIFGNRTLNYNATLYDRVINTAYQTSLEIATISQPTAIPKNGVGNFIFKITNFGPSTTNPIILTHIVSKGSVVNFIPSQGKCSGYSIISLCNLGSLLPGTSLNLQVAVKATNNALLQAISLSSPPTNVTSPVKSSILVSTAVTP
jgi:WD40-like Beta Propeller Repeat